MKLFKKGDLIKCHMINSDGSPSEWTGRMALIIKCLESENYNPFIEEAEYEQIAGVSARYFNLYSASDVKYKVMIGRRLFLVNHSCFIEKKEGEYIDWKIVVFDEEKGCSYFNYL